MSIEKFTASNGVQVWITESDGLVWSGVWSDVEQGLREYFQAERDEELGRWRDPENPDMVVYPDPSLDWVLVLDEESGDTDIVSRQGRESHEDDDFTLVADRYFDAHPEKQPWHDAKPGEVWAITIRSEERPYRCGANGLYSIEHGAHLSDTAPQHVTAGRRLWPEGDDQ